MRAGLARELCERVAREAAGDVAATCQAVVEERILSQAWCPTDCGAILLVVDRHCECACPRSRAHRDGEGGGRDEEGWETRQSPDDGRGVPGREGFAATSMYTSASGTVRGSGPGACAEGLDGKPLRTRKRVRILGGASVESCAASFSDLPPRAGSCQSGVSRGQGPVAGLDLDAEVEPPSRREHGLDQRCVTNAEPLRYADDGGCKGQRVRVQFVALHCSESLGFAYFAGGGMKKPLGRILRKSPSDSGAFAVHTWGRSFDVCSAPLKNRSG